MPIFEYKCDKCNECFSVLLKNSNEESVKCPQCGGKPQKQLSSFAAVVKQPQQTGKCGGCEQASICPNAR